MNEPAKSRQPLTVHAPLQLEPGRGFQFIEFKPGMTGVIESGRVMTDVPAVRKSGEKPPEAGYDRAGENREAVTRDAGEQAWFRETFCNGAQHCLQGWDWAFATSTRKLGSGTGIAMVGREGTANGRFTTHYWECVCPGPFCVGGTECFSNRPFGVKHFQTIHHCSVDVAHGLVLLFGIGTKALPSWDSRTRRNNLWAALPSV